MQLSKKKLTLFKTPVLSGLGNELVGPVATIRLYPSLGPNLTHMMPFILLSSGQA
jgi:hypothetical protein